MTIVSTEFYSLIRWLDLGLCVWDTYLKSGTGELLTELRNQYVYNYGRRIFSQ